MKCGNLETVAAETGAPALTTGLSDNNNSILGSVCRKCGDTPSEENIGEEIWQVAKRPTWDILTAYFVGFYVVGSTVVVTIWLIAKAVTWIIKNAPK